MELVMGEDLTTFFQNRAITNSLATKLMVMLNLVLGLRDLLDFNIVHLDLKPWNVMVTRLLFPKIIDFGEAFHPEVCTKGKFFSQVDYVPGYTFPYVAPEVYQLCEG